MPSNPERFRIQRTPEGGVSIGWSALSTYLHCPELARWQYHHGSQGIEPADEGDRMVLWYGKLWHAMYEGSLLGRTPAEVWASAGVPEGSALTQAELEGDMLWYQGQMRSVRVRVLHCEDEVKLRVGRHELRGTPDLVAEVEADWGGGIYILDHKTFVALSIDRRGYMRLNQRPSEATLVRVKHSRQFPFYAGLVREALGYDVVGCLVNFVPQRVNWAMQEATGRKRTFQPEVARDFIFPNADLINATLRDAAVACDRIERDWDEGQWTMNGRACVTAWGGTCQFLPLCEARNADRPALIESLFRPREIV